MLFSLYAETGPSLDEGAPFFLGGGVGGWWGVKVDNAYFNFYIMFYKYMAGI